VMLALGGVKTGGRGAMRAALDVRLGLHILGGAAAFMGLTSCSEPTGPAWEYAGVHQVRVDYLQMPASIAPADTLLVRLWGDTSPYGRLSLTEIEAVREPTRLDLTIWAGVEVWAGSGTMPPFDGSLQCDYKAPPPFEAGQFRVVIHQPDGSQWVDTLLVETERRSRNST